MKYVVGIAPMPFREIKVEADTDDEAFKRAYEQWVDVEPEFTILRRE